MLISLSAFVNFYLMTVFALSWGTRALGYTREEFLLHPTVRHAVLRADDSVVGELAERGRRKMLMQVNASDRSSSVW